MAKHLKIEGQVQGVGYRASFAAAATALELAGWVRNLRDGSVEACVEGDAAAIDSIVAWAWSGPPAALVNRVLVEESEEIVRAGEKFAILRSL